MALFSVVFEETPYCFFFHKAVGTYTLLTHTGLHFSRTPTLPLACLFGGGHSNQYEVTLLWNFLFPDHGAGHPCFSMVIHSPIE